MSTSKATQRVVVIGGGPAGETAVLTLAQHGVPVMLVDESEALGGRYYKSYVAAPLVSRSSELDALQAEGAEKASQVRASNAEVRLKTLAWGLFPDRQLGLIADDQAEVVEPAAVVLATGAIERLAAFPGWTLPGVMTAGAVQTILSRDAVLPGQRVLVAGTGPLLLATALEIAEAGGEVVAVIEGSGASAPLRHIHHFLGQRRRVRQAIDYTRALRTRGIPVMHGRTVIAAGGTTGVEEAIVARIDHDWSVIPGSEERFEVDTLCLHYGFVAATELARMVDCAVAFDRARGGWYVAHDEGMRTDQPGIYVAGQLATIGGADLAMTTGRLAGLTVARDLGAVAESDYQHAANGARKEMVQSLEFARTLNTVYSPGPGLANVVTPETTLCRCEEVSAEVIDRAIGEGAVTLNDLKRRTRCGMGLCQGRICSPVLVDYLQRRVGNDPVSAGLITARPPVRPIPLATLATLQREPAPGR